MKRYLTIEIFEELKLVTYYTVRFKEEKENLTDLFFTEYENDARFEEDIFNMADWLEDIGNNRGANKRLFRKEQDAQALPPYIEHLFAGEAHSLRLYCKRLSSSVVILMGGAHKTAKKVEDCKHCGPHFQLANLIAKKIEELIAKSELSLEHKRLTRFTKVILEIETGGSL